MSEQRNRNPYASFVSTLDSVAKKYPEVYRAVYEHIRSRKENAYVRLAEHCKRKNNEYARKFSIIEWQQKSALLRTFYFD